MPVVTRVLGSVALLAPFVLATTGCRDRASANGRGDQRGTVMSGLSHTNGAPSYRTIRLVAPGRVVGAVIVRGELPPDTVVRPTNDTEVCGTEFSDVTIEHDAEKLAGAVVWLDGLHAGKPLPLVKRYDVVNEGCLLRPRVQAAVVGGTLDIRSLDPIIHRTRLVRSGETQPIALVTETDEGQVVPLDHALDVPGLVELRCDLHPWTRGWIAVFDHPYFAVTGRDGTFSIDSVPPGQYTLHVWHERLGALTRPVTVDASGSAKVQVELRYQSHR